MKKMFGLIALLFLSLSAIAFQPGSVALQNAPEIQVQASPTATQEFSNFYYDHWITYSVPLVVALVFLARYLLTRPRKVAKVEDATHSFGGHHPQHAH